MFNQHYNKKKKDTQRGNTHQQLVVTASLLPYFLPEENTIYPFPGRPKYISTALLEYYTIAWKQTNTNLEHRWVINIHGTEEAAKQYQQHAAQSERAAKYHTINLGRTKATVLETIYHTNHANIPQPLILPKLQNLDHNTLKTFINLRTETYTNETELLANAHPTLADILKTTIQLLRQTPTTTYKHPSRTP